MTTDTFSSPSAADRDQLAVLHVPLVAHLVRETMARVPSYMDRNDLLSAGLLALLAAARDADRARPASFAAHATLRVRGALVDELRSVDWAARATSPRDPIAARRRLDTVLASFADAAGVAVTLGLPVDGGADAGRPTDRPGVVGSDRRSRSERVQCLVVALEELPQRLRHVARGYFVDQRPMAELAAEIGASEARAEQLRTEALVLLRDALAAAMDLDDAASLEVADADRRRLAYTRSVAQQYAARQSTPSSSRQRLETSA